MYGAELEKTENQTSALSACLAGVYGWMTFALALSGLCAWAVGTTPKLAKMVLGNPIAFFGLIILEFVLVIGISAGIRKMSAALATALFAAYAAVNGLTLSFIFIAYTPGAIASTFFVTAGTFSAMAVYGTVTKQDLSRFGSILMMALIGLIIASVVNLFWANSTLYWIVTYAGVLIFVGLTAWDAQKIKRMYQASDGSFETNRKIAVIGALELYLDFINLFLYLLRIFGNRR